MLPSSFGSRLARSPHLLLAALALAHCGTSSSPTSGPASVPSNCADASNVSNTTCENTSSGVVCSGTCSDTICGSVALTPGTCSTAGWVCGGHACGMAPDASPPHDAGADAAADATPDAPVD